VSPARRLFALLVTLAVALMGVGLAAPAAQAAGSESAFVSAINASRGSAGLSGLKVRADLVSVARAQAARMAAKKDLYHTPNLGGAVKNWKVVGENVGYGPDVTTLHRAFMNSAPHRANILDKRFTEVGVGVVVADGTIWVSEVFRRPATAAAAPAPTRTKAPATAKPKAASSRSSAAPAAKPAPPAPARPAPTPRVPEGVVCDVSPEAPLRVSAALAAHRTARLVEQAQRLVLGFQCGKRLPLTGVMDDATRRALAA
jgi:hypothetical protein